jgi:hypothetical protein
MKSLEFFYNLTNRLKIIYFILGYSGSIPLDAADKRLQYYLWFDLSMEEY